MLSCTPTGDLVDPPPIQFFMNPRPSFFLTESLMDFPQNVGRKCSLGILRILGVVSKQLSLLDGRVGGNKFYKRGQNTVIAFSRMNSAGFHWERLMNFHFSIV